MKKLLVAHFWYHLVYHLKIVKYPVQIFTQMHKQLLNGKKYYFWVHSNDIPKELRVKFYL